MAALKTATRYFFSISVFTLILFLFGANDVLATIKNADVTSLLIAVGFALFAQFFSAIRLRQLLVIQNIMLSLGKVFLIGLSTVFYGLVIPGGSIAAFAVRFVQLSRNARIELVAAALVVDRVIATTFLVIIGAIAFSAEYAAPLWFEIILIGIILGTGMAAFGCRSSEWVTHRLDNFANNESPGRLRRFGRRICRALLNYMSANGGQVLIVLTVSLVAHLCGCLAYYVIAIGIGLDLPFLSICWIRSGLILSTMVPVSVGGLGVREITAVSLLVPLGIDEALSVGFSILIFLGTSVILGLIGGLSELLGTTGRQ